MISVSVPKEISDNKEKVIFGLSLRQLVCGVIAVGLAVATGLLLVQVLGLSIDIAGYIIMVEVVPLMALGFVRPRGRPFEEFARLYLDSKLGRHKFSYQTESLIDLTLIPERSSHGDFNISKGQRGGGPRGRYGKRTKGGEALYLYQKTASKQKRKRQSARRQIKAALKECRAARRQAKRHI